MVYVNQVGGQDDLIFDGTSFVINQDGHVALQAPTYQEGLFYAEYDAAQKHFKVPKLAPL